jgi:predicted oxidoreductase
MKRIKMTSDGFSFSAIAQGFWRLVHWGKTYSELERFVRELLDLGVTTFDHADIYGGYTCEEKFGEVLRKNPELRKGMEIVTKCGIRLVSPQRPENKFHFYDTTRGHIIKSVENSLRALNTDFIDVLLIHRPDPIMNADETADAFVELKNSGKVRYFGVSNFHRNQFELLQSRLPFPLVTNQIEFSPINMSHQDNGDLDFLQKERVILMAWSPFAGGRIFTEKSEQAERLRKELSLIATEMDVKGIEKIILAWILKHPANLIPILGSGKIEHVRSAVEAVEINLTREQWFRIWTASKGHEVP